jgi:hypothetical protein
MSAAQSCKGALQALLPPQREKFHSMTLSAEKAFGARVKTKPTRMVKENKTTKVLFPKIPFNITKPPFLKLKINKTASAYKTFLRKTYYIPITIVKKSTSTG